MNPERSSRRREANAAQRRAFSQVSPGEGLDEFARPGQPSRPGSYP